MNEIFLQYCVFSFNMSLLNNIPEASRIVFHWNGHDPENTQNYSYFEKCDGYWYFEKNIVNDNVVLSHVHKYMMKHQLTEPHIL
jgi:hypothetical protein